MFIATDNHVPQALQKLSHLRLVGLSFHAFSTLLVSLLTQLEAEFVLMNGGRGRTPSLAAFPHPLTDIWA